MDILMWFVHWIGHSLPLLQIYSDTGYWWARQESMPAIQRNIHDRLTAWILKEPEKRETKKWPILPLLLLVLLLSSLLLGLLLL